MATCVDRASLSPVQILHSEFSRTWSLTAVAPASGLSVRLSLLISISWVCHAPYPPQPSFCILYSDLLMETVASSLLRVTFKFHYWSKWAGSWKTEETFSHCNGSRHVTVVFNLHLSNALCKYFVPVPPHTYFNVRWVILSYVQLCWWDKSEEALGLPRTLPFCMSF